MLLLNLLDQDTRITENYIEALNHFFSLETKVCAAFPVLENKNLYLSPHAYSPFGGPWFSTRKLNYGMVKNKYVSAFNSATVFSVSDIESIGGFPEDFPLDMLDTCVCYRLSRSGKSFFVLNCVLQHDLSVQDYEHNMNKTRYLSLIQAENRLALQMGTTVYISLKIRLFLRFINLLETTHPRPRFIDHYSSELCVTAKHLSEVCKKVSGRTALQWITEFIENDIRHYLLHTDLSIKEIVYQLQFPNASFFGKYVRAHFGKSPSEFRRSTGTK